MAAEEFQGRPERVLSVTLFLRSSQLVSTNVALAFPKMPEITLHFTRFARTQICSERRVMVPTKHLSYNFDFDALGYTTKRLCHGQYIYYQHISLLTFYWLNMGPLNYLYKVL